MIIWNSLKLFPHILGYLFIFANIEIYVIKNSLKNSQDDIWNSSDVFVIKGFTALNTQWTFVENSQLRILSFKIVNVII